MPDGGNGPQGWTKTTPWDIYKASFAGCDLYNKTLKRFNWPFMHKGAHGLAAESNIGDFIEAVVLQNSHHAWTSLRKDNENVTYYQFLIELSHELQTMALNLTK
jgi:hypothetical protein